MNVRQYPIIAKFGIMHLLATNLCIWIFSTITEVHSSYTANGGSPIITVRKDNQTGNYIKRQYHTYFVSLCKFVYVDWVEVF